MPTLKGLESINTNFKGFLYAGLMIINNEPFLIEYNVRMGDPECQTILPKLKSDFGDIIISFFPRFFLCSAFLFSCFSLCVLIF